MGLFLPFFTILEVQYFGLRNFSKILNFYKNSKSQNMDIFGLRIFVEVQYDIFKILSPKNIYRSLPSKMNSMNDFKTHFKKNKMISTRDRHSKYSLFITNIKCTSVEVQSRNNNKQTFSLSLTFLLNTHNVFYFITLRSSCLHP